jgi:hypothetical protein
MNPSLKIEIHSRGNVLSLNRAPATITSERKSQKTVTRTKTCFRIWPLIRPATEFVAGLFVVFYLLAALALGGALLFFTLFR